MRTRVVHCMQDPYDVYIGRGLCPKTGKLGDLGNPFKVSRDGAQALTRFVRMLGELREGELSRLIGPLDGKVLGCWCIGPACHGEVLAKLANGMPLLEVQEWAERWAQAIGNQMELFA